MSAPRALIAACLTLVLIATSGAMAVARGQMAAGPGVTLVICTGDGTETLRLDADGNPVHASHACPDCVITGAAPLPMQTALLEMWQTATPPVALPVPPALAPAAPSTGGYPRAPPDPRLTVENLL